MRKLIVTMWQSLDGFISGPDGRMDWVTSHFDPEMGAYEDALVSNAEILLFGRITYESFAGSWPSVPENNEISEEERAYARRLNEMRKVVFSRTMPWAKWQNSQLERDNLEEVVTALKKESGKDILIYGSASLVCQLTDLRLIDEYQLMIFPVLLAGGKTLFSGLQKPVDLRLCRTKVHSSGVAELSYELA